MGKQELKKLGVIGGMGPKATALFYDGVIDHTVAETDQEHIDMVILNKTDIPDRTEAIISGNGQEVIKALVDCAVVLEKLEVSAIAMPCNTAHFYIKEIQDSVNVPIINMVESSVRYARERTDDVKKIGIMATDGTIAAGVYHDECVRQGVEPVTLSDERQREVMSLIYDDVKSGKPGNPEKFNRVIEEFMQKECDAVILACTELSVHKDNFGVPEFCIDSTDVLVKESILICGAQYK